MSEEVESEQTFVEYTYQIERLTRTYQKAQAAFGLDTITKERDKLRARVHELELENQRSKQQLDDTERRLGEQSKRARQHSFFTWALSILALISSGLGINFITGDNQAAHIPGLALVAFAILLECFNFWLVRLK